jgi:hypothetical protein
MAGPTAQARTTAPAPAPAAGRSPSARAATPAAAKARGKRAGKPAVRLSSEKPPRPKGGAGVAPAEGPAADAKPTVDPRLKAALDKNKRNAKGLKTHDPAEKKAGEAQEAAAPPPNAKLADAQADKVGEMQEAEGKKPDTNSFAELMKREIEKALPKSVEGSANYLNEDETRKLKESAGSNIEAQKQAATGQLKTAAETPPDTSVIPDKEVTPLPPEALPPARPAPVGARDAMPAPLPEEEVSLQGSKDEAQKTFAENKITPAQLRKANDPRFTAALEAKESVDKNADTAPGQYRASEQKTLDAAAARAVADERRQVAGMKDAHGKSGAGVQDRQTAAKAQDEARRKEVADNIERIFGETKKNVEDKLSTLETDVNAMFDRGLDDALKDMRKYIKDKKAEWKEDRYGSFPLFNAPLWGYDKLKGIDKVPGIKKIYVDANDQFIRDLNRVVDRIAAHVEAQLKAAKDEVAAGQKKISDYVASLPKDLKEFGAAAERDINGRFEELRQGIEDKKNDLAQNLAQRYKDAKEKAQQAIDELKAEDKGLVTAFIEKIGEIIEILRNFKNRVLGMIKKAAAVIDLIVSDPIGFLKNLLAAVKQGVSQFASNIWEHLKAGFMGWLFGALGGIGIQLPKDFSLPSILSLVMQVLGLTPERIRARVVKFIGERNMKIIETVWAAVKIIIDGGPAALWEKIKEYLGNLKDMLVQAIQEWVVTKIIQAAVTKLVSMFNPVGAIIQAIIAIYNTVMFFIERINQILEFVEAVVNSVDKIARGAIGDAAGWIEKALARTIPVIISFLARLIGLGGVSEKVREFITRLQTKIENALDKIIEKILGGIKKVAGAVVGAGQAAVAAVFEWWKKKMKVGKGKETHTLYFEGDEENAELYIQSSPTPLANYVKGLRGNANYQGAEQVKILDRIDKRIVEMRALRVEWKAAKKRGWVNVEADKAAEIDKGFAYTGGQLGDLFEAGGDYGTEKDPISINWPGPPSAEYRTLYFGGYLAPAERPKKQSVMKGLFKKGQDSAGKPVKEYFPHNKATLPDGDEIGLHSDFHIHVGKVVGPLTEETTAGGGKLLSRIGPYGFNSTEDDMQLDHVHEIQFGGLAKNDTIDNLWPLQSGRNSAKGSGLAGATVQYPKGHAVRIATLKTIKNEEVKKKEKFYFKVVTVGPGDK